VPSPLKSTSKAALSPNSFYHYKSNITKLVSGHLESSQALSSRASLNARNLLSAGASLGDLLDKPETITRADAGASYSPQNRSELETSPSSASRSQATVSEPLETFVRMHQRLTYYSPRHTHHVHCLINSHLIAKHGSAVARSNGHK
jgi:hypothetical protein